MAKITSVQVLDGRVVVEIDNIAQVYLIVSEDPAFFIDIYDLGGDGSPYNEMVFYLDDFGEEV